MKIAILLLNQGRGSGEVARQHANFLIKLGHEIYFLHPKVGEGVKGAKNIDIDLGDKIMPVHEYLPSAKAGQKAVSTMEAEEAFSYLPIYESVLESIIADVDIVIGHHANLTSIMTANVCQKYNKPFTLFLHGTGIEPRHHGGYDDLVWEKIDAAIKQANGVMVTTDYVRDELICNMVDIPKEKVFVLPCGVDTENFHPDNIAGIKEKYDLPEKYVICPGAITKMKGPQNVALAANEYFDMAPTIFIGGGDMEEELAKLIGDNGKMLGFVSMEDKTRLINAATVLTAAPEKLEHFGIIYAEGLAGGTISVAYDGGGVPTIITKDVGFLVERNPKALGQCIRKVLEMNETDRQVMESNCRKRALEVFDYQIIAKHLADWLKTFL